MVSFFIKLMIFHDIYGLFNSILLKQTVRIVVCLIFKKYPDLKITRKELEKLVEFVISGTNVLFDINYYH